MHASVSATLLVLAASSITYRSASAGYDSGLAKFAAHCSGATYQSSPQRCFSKSYVDVSKRVSRPCGMWGHTCSGYTAVAKGKKYIVIAFRGTNNAVQLYQEIVQVAPLVPLSAGRRRAKAHLYFRNGANALYATIKNDVRSLRKKYGSYKVLITGHSLGGALASVTAFRLIGEGVVPGSKVKLYTFGMPRVGDQRFANAIDDMVKSGSRYRLVNDNDIVTNAPPRELFGAYRHHRTMVHHRNGRRRICTGQEPKDCPAPGLILSISGALGQISDHINYLGRNIMEYC